MRRLTPDAALVAVMVLLTLAPALVLIGSAGAFNGTLGVDVPDLMQYMGFIRESGEHLLVGNPFDVVPDPRLFLDPVFALSGLLWRLGASIQLALLVWVPITALLMLITFRAYARRILADPAVAALAVVLALIFITPATPLSDWLGGGPTLRFGTSVVGLELFAGAYPWSSGQALAIALLPACLLLTERGLQTADPWRVRLRALTAAGGLGLLVTWIHPWQGLTLLVIWGLLGLWGRFARPLWALLLPGILTALPLGYFLALSHTHSSWAFVSHTSGYHHFGLWLWISVLPLLLALAGLRGPAPGTRERILRLWPLAGLIVYLALDTTWYYHAFVGLSLPLAILAVRGWRRLRLPRWLGAAVAAAATAPGLVWIVLQLADTRTQHFFAPGEAQALALLDRLHRPGPVLAATMPLGQAVPAFTGRNTFTGHPTWTPGYQLRTALVDALLDGRLPRARAVELVRVSRAVFLAEDCRPGRLDLRPVLGGLVLREWRLGCARVYELGGGSRQAQAVPASAPRVVRITVKPARPSSSSTSRSLSGAGA